MRIPRNTQHLLMLGLLATLAPSAQAHSGNIGKIIPYLLASAGLAFVLAIIGLVLLKIKGAGPLAALKRLVALIVIWCITFVLIFVGLMTWRTKSHQTIEAANSCTKTCVRTDIRRS
jgi:hypothetical protein